MRQWSRQRRMAHCEEPSMGLFQHKGELSIPPVAKADRDAVEIARIWAAQGTQQVSLRPDIWDDPAAWGIMLVDLARHVANACQQSSGRDRRETLARIRAGFDAEWDAPTDEPSGHMG
jgi:hypothetical protein